MSAKSISLNFWCNANDGDWRIAFPAPDARKSQADRWQEVQDVPCWLAAEIPVTGFSVRDLLLLQIGSLVNSKRDDSGKDRAPREWQFYRVGGIRSG